MGWVAAVLDETVASGEEEVVVALAVMGAEEASVDSAGCSSHDLARNQRTLGRRR